MVAIAMGIATFGQPTCAVIPGWTQDGTSRMYEGDKLFDYMDGNSEGYFVYGFVRMNGVTCTQAGQKVLIDISRCRTKKARMGFFAQTEM
jgi:hypothetical protein